jgi:CoA:oxalate CoA-transferase
MSGPLEGIRVLDLTWVLAGPFASMILCDLGADVIKVERPPYGDAARGTGPIVNGESCYFFSINRGKKSVCFDLKAERGKALFLRLVDLSDVVMENFTPGTMDKLGLGYSVLQKRNPRLIYAATSGFGQTGPERLRPALDIVVQGMGGVMSITGEPDGPPVRPGLSLGDIAAGRQIAILENAFIRYFATGELPKPIGSRHPLATPFQAFPTSDGWIVLALSWGVENQWELLCATIGRVDLIDHPRFDTPALRTEHHAELEPILNEAMRQKTTSEWLREFDAIGLPCGPLNNIAQAAEYPQVLARRMLVDVEHPRIGRLKLPDTPVKLSRTPGGIKGPSPALGQDTYEVLSSLLGLSTKELDELAAAGVIVGPRA